MSEERLVRIEEQIGELRDDVRGTNDRLEAVNQRIGVLHEEVLDRIAALGPDFAPVRREFKAADAEILESINRRLEPLETAAKNARPKRRG
jgi:uncharacterized coiled-coil DUF342 family protein